MIEDIKKIAMRTRKQVENLFPDLSLFVLVYTTGQKKDQLLLEQEHILDFPAGKNTFTLFQRSLETEKSGFHGFGTSRRKNFLFSKASVRFQAALSLNIDEFDDLEQATKYLYGMICEAMDAAIHQRKMDKENIPNIIVPKSFFKTRIRQNIRSHAFASIMMSLDGNKGAIEKEAAICARASLNAKPGVVPEENPFALVAQTASFAFDNIFREARNQVMPVMIAYHIAQDVDQSMDESSLKFWYKFASAAQEMAWQGYSETSIINAALISAQSHHVRGIAHLVAELADIRTSSFQIGEQSYNPFSDLEENKALHLRLVSDVFEKAVAKGLEEGNARPLYDLANEQNMKLLKGKVVGWCAAGLQAAGKAFENALQTGREPLQSAWLEFEGHKAMNSWDSLQKIAKTVMTESRTSQIVSFDGLKKIISGLPNTQIIIGSIQTTLDDPAFAAAQAANNNLYVAPALSPRAEFSPKASQKLQATPNMPSYGLSAPNYQVPSLTLGGGAQSRTQLQHSTSEKEDRAEQ